MTTPLSLDLRVRVLAAVAAGLSHRAAGERFGVSPASVSRWRALERQQGHAKPKAMGGDPRSHKIEAHAELILSLLEQTPDIAIQEFRAALGERGVAVGYGGLWRLLDRHGITLKKMAHAAEQDRPDSLSRREAWFEDQFDLDPERLVFMDETWASTNMARSRGRAPRGKRLRASVPHGHWKTTTLVAGLRRDGIVAPFVLDGPISRAAFETYVGEVLVPALRPGDIVILDNLSSHKGVRIRQLMRRPGRAFAICRPTRLISTRSRTPFPS